MKEYIATLLLIAPGFIVRIIKDILIPGDKTKSDFEKTVLSLIYGIPVFLINYIVLEYRLKIDSILDLTVKFNSLSFIVKFAILTLITTIIVALVISFLNSKLMLKIINLIRGKFGEHEIGRGQSVWNAFWAEGQPYKAVAIYKGDKLVTRGFRYKWTTSADEDKEIVLEAEDIFNAHEDWFNVVDKTYYNVNTDITIKEYNLDKLYSEQKNK